MTDELAIYANQLKLLLQRLCALLAGLDEEALNWHLPASGTNSIYVLAAHTLGNAEAWVLGIACGQLIARDRPAEFGAAGPDPAPLIAKARDLAQRFDEALAALPETALDEVREPAQSLFGEGMPRAVSVREALMVTIEHASNHLGHIDITRDLALAARAGEAAR